MVTERSYKHALAVIEQYSKEQEESKELNLKNAGITTTIGAQQCYNQNFKSE